MTTQEAKPDTEAQILRLLQSTNRKGMIGLIGHLQKEGFFEAPASSRFHGSYAGGLAAHSLDVYNLLLEMYVEMNLDAKAGFGQMPMKIKSENLLIAGLLHDLCKIGAYVKTKAGDGWTNNRNKEPGHATLSISRIEKFIELEKLEEMMIRYHMGIYGLFEFQDKQGDPNGEYSLRGDHRDCVGLSKEDSQKRRYGKSLANAWFHNPVVKVMSFCDNIATLRKQANDSV